MFFSQDILDIIFSFTGDVKWIKCKKLRERYEFEQRIEKARNILNASFIRYKTKPTGHYALHKLIFITNNNIIIERYFLPQMPYSLFIKKYDRYYKMSSHFSPSNETFLTTSPQLYSSILSEHEQVLREKLLHDIRQFA